MRKVMVLTDNAELLRFLDQEVQSQGLRADASIDYRYSERNKNPYLLEDCGAASIDLKQSSQVDFLINEYDCIISLHCKQIFPEALVSRVRCVNFHPGYNPYNRGWYPQVFSIINGKQAGVTVHEMDAQIDHGPVIDRIEVTILRSDTSKDVYERVIEAEKQLIKVWLQPIIKGDYNASPPAQEGNYNGIADFKALRELDLDHVGSLREHLDKLRALSHEPHWNAYFWDEDNKPVYVRLQLKASATDE